MTSIPKGWSKQDNQLLLSLKCKDFKHALALLNSIGDIAEQLQHHPDLGIRGYNQVFVSTTTHTANQLTDKDYELAHKINQLLDYQTNKKQIETFGRKQQSSELE